jgi:hypothetical protein
LDGWAFLGSAQIVNEILEFLANLKVGKALGLDCNGSSGSRVAALVGAIAPGLKTAETTNFYPLVVAKGIRKALENHVD